MSGKLRLSSEAEDCIEEQLQWYEVDERHGGAVLGEKWLQKLETALGELQQHPERHGFAPENGRWLPHLTIRQLRFQPWKSKSAWRVLYVYGEDTSTVTVLQIRHEKRPLLFEMDRP